jgi:hypothetical protein
MVVFGKGTLTGRVIGAGRLGADRPGVGVLLTRSFRIFVSAWRRC